MALFAVNPQLLGKCTSCVARQILVAPASRALYRNQSIRLATTAAKPRTKTAATSTSEVASVPKKRISTKTSAAAAPAKSPRKKKSDAVLETTTVETATPAVKKATRAASTKTTAAKKQADADAVAEEPKPKATRTRKAATTTAAKTAPTREEPRFVKATEIPQANEPAAKTAEDGPHTMSEVPDAIADSILKDARTHAAEETSGTEGPKKSDPSSPEFKQAERRYVSTMVALPILLVTSYYLFDRLALGHQPKSLEDFRVPPVGEDGKRATPEA